MKFTLLTLMICFAIHAFSQEDYTIRINGKTLPIALDQPYEMIVNGQKMVFTVKANDTLTYSDEFISFRYTKDFKITKTSLDEGIEQIMLMSAEGTGFLIQKYATLNPSLLHELMLNEVTKESVNYGFSMNREDYNKKLSSGNTIKIDRAVLKYKDETNIYEVASIAKKDSGVLVMTMKMDGKTDSQGQKMIDLMWKTLVVK